ncbi:MAG: hypothetical protein KC646_03670 [Candidatus Cloacimonetes bacterium]|nr:hypothetical protein [Candidatus Cloacimonadota bacterium]
MNQKSLYYKPSGSIGPVAIVLSVVFGLIASLILGTLYGYMIYYLPFIYFNFIIVILYGFGVGSATGIGAKFGKARNSTVLGLIALCIGVLSFYFGWVSWMHALTEQNVLKVDLIAVFSKFNPSHVYSMASDIAQTGAWSIFGWTPKGFSLYLVWGVESLMIIFLTVVAAVVIIDEPFCERCNTWIQEDSTISPYPFIEDEENYKASLEKEGVELVLNQAKLETSEAKFSEYQLFVCKMCNSNQMLTVSNVELSLNSEGKEEQAKTEIAKHILLDKAQISTLKSDPNSDVIS